MSINENIARETCFWIKERVENVRYHETLSGIKSACRTDDIGEVGTGSEPAPAVIETIRLTGDKTNMIGSLPNLQP